MQTLARTFAATALVALAAASAAPGAAAAQNGGKDTPEYRDAIASALQEFELGNYPEARAAFQRAHQLYPNARTLRGMGLSAFEARDYVEAIELLSAASESAEQPLTEAQRAEARAVIERAKGYVSRLEVELSPAHAALAVDGQPVRLEEGQLVLNPGEYQIQAHAEGRQPVTLSISAKAGRSTTITISLPPVSAAAPADPTQAAEPAAAGRSAWPYVVGGTGAALLVASAITGAATAGAEDDLRASCGAGRCDEDARDRGKSMQVATNVLLPVGAALLVGGVVWWLLDAPPADASRAGQDRGMALGCVPGACSVELRGAF